MPTSLRIDDREELVRKLLAEGRFSNQYSIEDLLRQAGLSSYVGTYAILPKGQDLLRNVITTLEDTAFLQDCDPPEGYTALGALLKYVLISNEALPRRDAAFLANLCLDCGLVNLEVPQTYEIASKWITEYLSPQLPLLDSVCNVFIGCTETDRYFGHKLALWLSLLGVTPWLDFGVSPFLAEKGWQRDLAVAVNTCDVMIVVVSPESMQADSLLRQYWGKFLDSHRRSFAVVYQPSPLHAELSELPKVAYIKDVERSGDVNPLKLIAQQLFASIQDSRSFKSIADKLRQLPYFVDRSQVCLLFDALLVRKSSEIIAIEGASGQGKSLLLLKLRQLCEEKNVASTLIDFEEPGEEDYRTVIKQAVTELVGADFLNTRQLAAVLASGAAQTGDDAKPAPHREATSGGTQLTAAALGDSLRYSAISRAAASESQKERETQSFVADLSQFSQSHQCVIFLDNFHKTSLETQKWILDNLMRKVRSGEFANTIIVLSGVEKSIPDADAYTLRNFIVDDVREYCNRRGLRNGVDPAELYRLTNNGNPFLLAAHVDMLLLTS